MPGMNTSNAPHQTGPAIVVDCPWCGGPAEVRDALVACDGCDVHVAIVDEPATSATVALAA
jgi:hypothetical protein